MGTTKNIISKSHRWTNILWFVFFLIIMYLRINEHSSINSWEEALDQFLSLIFSAFIFVLGVVGLIARFSGKGLLIPAKYFIVFLPFLFSQWILESLGFDSERFGAMGSEYFAIHSGAEIQSIHRDLNRIKRKGKDLNASNGHLFFSMTLARRSDFIAEFGHYMSEETIERLKPIVCELNAADVQLAFYKHYRELSGDSNWECGVL